MHPEGEGSGGALGAAQGGGDRQPGPARHWPAHQRSAGQPTLAQNEDAQAEECQHENAQGYSRPLYRLIAERSADLTPCLGVLGEPPERLTDRIK